MATQARGVRKSPYIGRKTDASSVLYQQYTSMESVLLESCAGKGNDVEKRKSVAADAGAAASPTPAAPTAVAVTVEQAAATPAKKAPKRPKKREREAAAAAAAAAAVEAAPPPPATPVAAAAAAAAPVAQEAAATTAAPPAVENAADAPGGGEATKKTRRRKRGKGGLGNGTAPSGPGNAEEAARIRDALGFADAGGAAKKKEEEEEEEERKEEMAAVAAAPAAAATLKAAAAAPAAAPAPNSSTFQFGFSELENDAVPVEREAKPEEAAGKAVGPSSTTAADGDAAPKRRARGGVKNQKKDGSNPPTPSLNSEDPLARRVFVGGMPFRFEEDEVREYWSWCGEIESMALLRFPDTGRFKGIAFITFAEEEGYKKALECDGTMLEGVRVKVERCKVGARGEGGAGRGVAESGCEAASSKPVFDAPAPKTPGYNVAYVGNIAFEASAEDVAALFNEALAPGVGEAGGAGERREEEEEGEKVEEVGEAAAAASGAAANGGDGGTLPLPPPPPRSAVTRVRLHTDKVTGKSRGYAHVHFLTEEHLDRAVKEVDGATLFGRAVRVGFAQPKKE